MVKNYEKECSEVFTVSRVFALISIVCAHINFEGAVGRAYSILGSIGVIAFLFMSSYYYRPEKFSSFFGMLKNKFISIGVPWIFLGTVVYLYNGMLSNKLSLMSYFKWIIGNGTYLYYLTVLFLCFTIFYKPSKTLNIVSIILTLISLILTAAGVMKPIVEFLHITNYLNIFNWIGIFSLGQLTRSADPKKLFEFFGAVRIYVILTFLLVAVLLVIFKKVEVGYFSYIGIYFELLGVLCIFCVSTWKVFSNKFFVSIANNSFAIYLIHMVLIGVMDRVYNIHTITQIISSLLVIAVAHIGLQICRFIIKKIKAEKFLNPLFGFRNRKITLKDEKF